MLHDAAIYTSLRISYNPFHPTRRKTVYVNIVVETDRDNERTIAAAAEFLNVLAQLAKQDTIDRNIANGVTGTARPASLKTGAPENKMDAGAVETDPKQQSLPLQAEKVGDSASASMAAAAISKASGEPKPAPAPAPAPVPQPAVCPQPPTAPPVTPPVEKKGRKKPEVVKTVTVDEVRALMVSLAAKGAEEQNRQRMILINMGYPKLSEVPPERLVEVMQRINGEWAGT